jgi:hypothetical protein
VSPEDEAALAAFLAPGADSYHQRTLADMVLDKIREKQGELGVAEIPRWGCARAGWGRAGGRLDRAVPAVGCMEGSSALHWQAGISLVSSCSPCVRQGQPRFAGQLPRSRMADCHSHPGAACRVARQQPCCLRRHASGTSPPPFCTSHNPYTAPPGWVSYRRIQSSLPPSHLPHTLPALQGLRCSPKLPCSALPCPALIAYREGEEFIPAELDPKVVEVYQGVGKVLSRYTAGKVCGWMGGVFGRCWCAGGGMGGGSRVGGGSRRMPALLLDCVHIHHSCISHPAMH